ncbi:DUF2187 family protein [Caldibacillus thermoamylovorans]
MEKETVTMGNLEGKRKKAKEGDMVEVKRGRYKGKKGEVLIVKENSVIIQLGINPKTGEPVKTVVNHKNYKRVK